MMRAARRASLLAAFCLLTSGATASAECAWVLWFRSGENWRVLAAYETLDECNNKAQKADKGSVELQRKMNEAEEKMLGKALPASVAFHCLPDTVDPRGPKGGAR